MSDQPGPRRYEVVIVDGGWKVAKWVAGHPAQNVYAHTYRIIAHCDTSVDAREIVGRLNDGE